LRQSYIKIRTVLITIVVTTVIMMILLYAPSPFVVLKPGIAVPAQGYIQTHEHTSLFYEQNSQEAEQQQEEGELLLTAVLLATPNLWEMLGSLVSPKDEVRLKTDVIGRSSMEEYAARVTTMMRGSHNHALEAAYRYLNIPYSIQPQKLIVQQPSTCLIVCGFFEAGDEIVAGVNAIGEEVIIHSVSQLHAWLTNQEAGEKVHLIVKRGDERLQKTITLHDDDLLLDKEKLVYDRLQVESYIELRSVISDDPDYHLDIATDNIGGPSAGLVLALTIIDQLTPGDLTKGKKIAVTGTINAEGEVGSIGGIVQKVYSTSEQGAQIFIVPKGNEEEARRTLKKLDHTMEIHGVSTLEEAMQVLASLQ